MLAERGYDTCGAVETMEGDWVPVYWVPELKSYCWEQNDHEFASIEYEKITEPTAIKAETAMEFCNKRGEAGRIYTGRSLLIFSDPMTYEEKSFLGEPCGAGEQYVDLEVLHTAGELGRSVSIEMDKTMSLA